MDQTKKLRQIYEGVNLEEQEDEEQLDNYKDFDNVQ